MRVVSNAMLDLITVVGQDGWGLGVRVRLPTTEGQFLLPMDAQSHNLARMLGVTELPCRDRPCRLDIDITEDRTDVRAIIDLLDDNVRWELPHEDVPEAQDETEAQEEESDGL